MDIAVGLIFVYEFTLSACFIKGRKHYRMLIELLVRHNANRASDVEQASFASARGAWR